MNLEHIIIRKERHPTRCKVCHQIDEFDPVSLLCRRCECIEPTGFIRPRALDLKEREMFFRQLNERLQRDEAIVAEIVRASHLKENLAIGFVFFNGVGSLVLAVVVDGHPLYSLGCFLVCEIAVSLLLWNTRRIIAVGIMGGVFITLLGGFLICGLLILTETLFGSPATPL